MFKTLEKATGWIESQVKFRPKTDLVRMTNALELLELDFSNIKKIHVAGTNGKGSTCAFLSAILIEAGYKVGTFTSPYLLKFNERIRYQLNDIADDELRDLISMIYRFNLKYEQKYQEKLSFFELITLLSLLYFKKKDVDIIIMEVGIGGLLDATNVLNYDLSLIVSVGFDHMKQLGNTYESIASNMLGILKPNNHLITTVDKSMHKFFNMSLDGINVTADFYTTNDFKTINNKQIMLIDSQEYKIPLIGEHQFSNALLAIKAVNYLFPKVQIATIKKGLLKTVWPGRLEKLSPNVYLDGAHNTHALEALKKTVKTLFKNSEIWVLFSSLGDKDVLGMLDIINSFSQRIVLTSFPDPRFIKLKKPTAISVEYNNDALDALHALKSQMDENTILLITGSLHFIGYLKQVFVQKIKKKVA